MNYLDYLPKINKQTNIKPWLEFASAWSEVWLNTEGARKLKYNVGWMLFSVHSLYIKYSGWTKVTVNMWHLPVVSGVGTCSSSKNGVSLWT